jgi:2-methylisocitrate lyase-like PEP mutase family enzyme
MSRRRSFRQALKRTVAERRLLVVPGAYDALSALLIERTGFDTMFVGGFRSPVRDMACPTSASRASPTSRQRYATFSLPATCRF